MCFDSGPERGVACHERTADIRGGIDCPPSTEYPLAPCIKSLTTALDFCNIRPDKGWVYI